MRILFVSGEYPPVTDGIGTFVAAVAPALAARGHDVHVLSCLPGQAVADAVDAGVHVHRRGHRRLPGLRRLGLPQPVEERLRTAATCRLEARRLGGRFDAIEVPDWMAEGLAMAVARPAAVVAHLHTPIGLVMRTSGLRPGRAERAADVLERVASRRANLVTAPSQLLVDRLRREGWLARRPWYRHGPIRIVRYPVDASRWASVAPVATTGPSVLAIGRLERRKAPEVLLEAGAALAGRIAGLELVFVGRSEERRDGLPYGAWLTRRAAEARLSCRIVDHVPHQALADWYGRARVVAVASRFDNFPMVGLETLASGRPLVCTEATGTVEILAGTNAGAVVPVDRPQALAEALLPYLSEADAAARGGEAGRRLVADVCAPERIAAEREACYLEAVERGRGMQAS